MPTILTLYICLGSWHCEPMGWRYVADPASCVSPNVVDMESGTYPVEKLTHLRHAVIDWPGRGDVDLSGIVDVDDITAILAIYSGEVLPPPDEADVCGCVGVGAVIDLEDIEGVISAFAGEIACQ